MKNGKLFAATLAGLLLFILFWILVTPTHGTDFPQAWGMNTYSTTLLTATTNENGTAYFVEQSKYHTVVITQSTVRTNTAYLDRSLDGTAWIPWHTNTFTTTGTVSEATCVGKWTYMRGRVDTLTGTNCSVTFKYLGGN